MFRISLSFILFWLYSRLMLCVAFCVIIFVSVNMKTDDNQLSGTIPVELSLLSNLEDLTIGELVCSFNLLYLSKEKNCQ